MKIPDSWVFVLAWCAIGCQVVFAARPAVDPALPHYEPRSFTLPKDATYVRPDGSIFIAGAKGMTVGLKNLIELFIKTHPGTRFTTLLPGSSVGLPAIVFNLSAFGVVDREAFPEEIVPFEYLYHHSPLGIRVGHGSYSKDGYAPPLAVCVNPSNPLTKLTTEQVARIFTTGGGKGDITTWGQLGLAGDWARHGIRPIGVGRRTGEAVFMRVEKFGDFPFTDRYEGMGVAEVAARLSQDVAAIALIGRANVPPGAKIIALSETADGYFSAASYEDVLAGRYPYARYTYFYVNRDPAKPMDPFVKEFLRMVLSKEGQQALVDEQDGFLPLSAPDVTEQLRRIE